MKTTIINHHLSDLLGFEVQKDHRRVVSEDYNLAVCYPNIAKEWHPIKNKGSRPEDVTPMSGKKFGGCVLVVTSGKAQLQTGQIKATGVPIVRIKKYVSVTA